MQLDVRSTTVGAWQVLGVTGEVDVASAAVLSEALADELAAGRRQVVVDLSFVAFLDSTGLGALVGAHRSFADAGGRLRVAAPAEHVRKVFDLTGLADTLGLARTVDEVCAGADDDA